MQKWVATGFGSNLASIELRDVPHPGDPGPGEVVVKVGATGISLPDLLLLRGAYPDMEHALPHPIGIEYAGTVLARGPGAVRLAVGDRVCGLVYPPQGSASEFLRVAERDVGRLPDHLTLVQGAALPSAFMTAHVALHRYGAVRAGERVLILSAASGVGLAATQMATAAGAKVHGAASDAKHEAVRAAGAVATHDYRVPGWERDLPEMDVVLDPIGGRSFTRSYAALRAGGRLVCLDAASRYPEAGATDFRREDGDPAFDPVDLMLDAKSVAGVNIPLLWPADGGQAAMLNEALAHIEAGGVTPAVSQTFAFDQLVDALRCVKERRNIGRVVLDRTAVAAPAAVGSRPSGKAEEPRAT